MAGTTETYEAKIGVDLTDTNAALNATYANMERLFRQVNSAGEEIETPFLKGLDSINRLRGNIDDVTDQLKLFGDRGAKTAGIIEGISDPVKRLAAAKEALAKAKQGGDPFQKMGDQVGVLKAKFSSLGPVTQGVLVGGFAAAGAAIAGAAALLAKFTSDALSKFTAGSAQMQGKIYELETAYGKLQNSVGHTLAEHLRLGDGLDFTTSAIEAISKYLEDNAQTVDDVAESVKVFGLIAVNIFSVAIPAGLSILTLTIDAVRYGLQGMIVYANGIALAFAKAGNLMGVVADETVTEYEALTKASFQTLKDTKSLTKGMWELGNSARDTVNGLNTQKQSLDAVGESAAKTAAAYKGLLERLRDMNDEIRGEAISAAGDFAKELTKAGVPLTTTTTYIKNLTDSLKKGTITIDQYKEAMDGLGGVKTVWKEAEKNASSYEEILARINKLQDEVDIARADSYKIEEARAEQIDREIDKQIFLGQLLLDRIAYQKLLRDESGAEGQITGAQGSVDQFGASLKSVQSDGVDAGEYQQVLQEYLQARGNLDVALANPLITSDELAHLQEQSGALDLKFQEFKKKYEDVSKNPLSTASIDATTASMNDAAKGAIMLGASMAGMALETLIAGDSMAAFGGQALQAFGSFASQAGQVILATGIGQLALFEGNPGGAIAAGIGLIALGSVLGGIAKRTMKKGGGGASRADTKQIVDSFRRQDNRDDEERNITVIAQFGTERFESVVSTAVMGGQRNGRLPRYSTR